MTDGIRRILFVCTGNICRSPTAEGVARRMLEQRGLSNRFQVDSAGTHGYHVGQPPDPRAAAIAQARGYDLSAMRARILEPRDFQRFDLLLAMDNGHMGIMRRMCPAEEVSRLQMFMDYAQDNSRDELPDPYYGNEKGFEIVLDCCEQAVAGLIRHLEGR